MRREGLSFDLDPAGSRRTTMSKPIGSGALGNGVFVINRMKIVIALSLAAT